MIRRRRSWRPLALGLVWAAVGAAPAPAEPPLHPLGPAALSPLRSDGRLVAYEPDGTGSVRVLDASARQVALVPPIENCRWAGIGDGTLLWNCGDQRSPYATGGLTYDLRSHAVTSLPAVPFPKESDVESALWAGIGSRWAQADYSGYHYAATEYVSRSTGEVRDSKRLRDRRLVADLDRPSLWRSLCRPLHAGTVLDDAGIDEEIPGAFAFAAPVGAGLWQRHRGDFALTPQKVLVGTCGHAERAVWRCRRDCSIPVVASQAVAWIDGTTAIVYLADRHRMWCWSDVGGTVALAGRRLFVDRGTHVMTAALPPVRATRQRHTGRSPGCRAAFLP